MKFSRTMEVITSVTENMVLSVKYGTENANLGEIASIQEQY